MSNYIKRAYKQGWRAGARGRMCDTCPYKFTSSPVLNIAWYNGWNKGMYTHIRRALFKIDKNKY